MGSSLNIDRKIEYFQDGSQIFVRKFDIQRNIIHRLTFMGIILPYMHQLCIAYPHTIVRR